MRKLGLCSLPTGENPQRRQHGPFRREAGGRRSRYRLWTQPSRAHLHAANARSGGMSLVRAVPARSTSIATAPCRALSKPVVRVVAAALFAADGKVLIA